MKVDETAPHPFRSGAMGYSRFYMIVDDEKRAQPRANNPAVLEGSDLARYQLRRWRNVPVKDTEAGGVERGPAKRLDDFGQLLQFVFHDGVPPSPR